MPISILCSHCEKKLKVPDTAAGKKIRCPSCKAVITVPEAEAFVAPDDLVEPDEDTAVTESPVSPPKKKKGSSDKGSTAFEEKKDNGGYAFDEDDDEEERPRKKKKKRRVYDDDDDDYGDMRPRRREEAHRGVVILILGILSIVTSCFCPLICWILAAIAVNMANTDLPKIDRRLMDANGRGLTVAGQVCGYVGVVLGLVSAVAGAVLYSTGM